MTKHIPKVICGSPDKPLTIGKLEIPCYVLEDETRVLHQRGMVNALGMSRGSSAGSGGDRLAKFISGKSITPYIPSKLYEVTQNPLKFRTDRGLIAYGYEATVLIDICEAVLEARKNGTLQAQQLHIAAQCEIVVRSFAKVGIIAVIDEITGFQDLRVKGSLAKILEKFIAEEYRAWTKTFPDAFYREIFRLKGWAWNPNSVKRPSVIGYYTNDIIYDRLAPGVLEELRRINPPTPKGYRKQKHFQWLTGDVGHPALRSIIDGSMALMRAAPNWRRFMESQNRAYPKYGENIALALEFKEDYKDQ